jgi:hypothetical protein
MKCSSGWNSKMNYNFQKTHIKVGLWKYFNSYDEKASFIAFGKSWKNSSYGIWNLLMHKTNHGFSKHFQIDSSGDACCSWHSIWTRDVKSPCPKYWTPKVIGFGIREKQWISFLDDGIMCFVVGLKDRTWQPSYFWWSMAKFCPWLRWCDGPSGVSKSNLPWMMVDELAWY